MASTPYLSQDKRDYITLHKLEEMVSLAINSVMRDEPKEPQSYLAKHFSGLSDNSIKLDNMICQQLFIDERSPFLEFRIYVIYKGQSYKFKHVHPFLQDYDNSRDVLIDKTENKAGNSYDLSKAVEFINESLVPFMKGKDLSNMGDFDEKLLAFCKEKHMRFKNITSAVSYAALSSVAALNDRSLMAQVGFQLTGAELPPGPLTLPQVSFRLFSGGPHLCPKFKASNINLIVNSEVHLAWKDLLHLVRKVFAETENALAKGKGGRDLVKPMLDGSYISPFDTIAEVIKVIEEALKAANATDVFSLWVNFGAHKYWNKDTSKYDFENFKKPSDPEEVEDLVAKLLLDKKLIKVVEDPFIIDHKSSWHRLNFKLKEKQHSVKFASRKYYSTQEEKKHFHSDFTEADFPPKTKNAAELGQKMNQAKAHIAYKVISFNDYFTFSEFLKKFGETKKAYATENITVTVIDPSQVVGDDLFLQTVMPMGPGGLSLGSPLIPARYLAWQSLPLAFPQPKAPEEVHHDTSTLNKESKETLHTKDKDKKTK